MSHRNFHGYALLAACTTALLAITVCTAGRIALSTVLAIVAIAGIPLPFIWIGHTLRRRCYRCLALGILTAAYLVGSTWWLSELQEAVCQSLILQTVISLEGASEKTGSDHIRGASAQFRREWEQSKNMHRALSVLNAELRKPPALPPSEDGGLE